MSRIRSAAKVTRLGVFATRSWLIGGGWSYGFRKQGRMPLIDNKGTLRLDGIVMIRSFTYRAGVTVEPGATLTIGDGSLVNQGVNIHCSTEITIGTRVQIGDLSCIYDTSFHALDASTPVIKAPVRIEDEVWLARNVTVLPGVTIGRGSVVATGAIVTEDVPPGVLVAGIPAKVVRKLDVPTDWHRP